VLELVDGLSGSLEPPISEGAAVALIRVTLEADEDQRPRALGDDLLEASLDRRQADAL
jgi:hypothetical protein